MLQKLMCFLGQKYQIHMNMRQSILATLGPKKCEVRYHMMKLEGLQR